MKEVFIKTFSNLEYATNFLKKGEMLFRHVDYFRKIEDGNVRGDLQEGDTRSYLNLKIDKRVEIINLHSEITGKTVPFNWKEYQEEHPELKGKTDIRLQMDYIAQVQIYCMTYIRVGMPNIDQIFLEIQKFGKYSVVIADEEAHNFIDRVRYSGVIAATNTVKYIDNPEMPSPFIKPKIYSNQSEFRMIKDAHDELETKLYFGEVNGQIWRTSALRGLKRHFVEN